MSRGAFVAGDVFAAVGDHLLGTQFAPQPRGDDRNASGRPITPHSTPGAEAMASNTDDGLHQTFNAFLRNFVQVIRCQYMRGGPAGAGARECLLQG
jgi:hypothetical protein